MQFKDHVQAVMHEIIEAAGEIQALGPVDRGTALATAKMHAVDIEQMALQLNMVIFDPKLKPDIEF